MATVEVLETNQTVEISETSQTVNVQSGVPDATSLQGNQLPSSPSDGELLRYNGTQWEHITEGNIDHDALTNFSSDEHRPFLIDTNTNRPSAGTQGRYFYNTTYERLEFDNGQFWIIVARGTPAEFPFLFDYTPGDSVTAKDGSFSRSSDATQRDYDESLFTAGSGTLRDFHWVEDENGVLVRSTRLEAARTNSILHSEDFSDAAWGKRDVTITVDDAVAPDGTTTADLVEITGSSSRIQQGQNIADDALNRAASVFVEKGTSTDFRLRIVYTSSTGEGEIRIDTTDGSIVSQSGNTHTRSGVEDWGNYWRVWVVAANGNDGANDIFLQIFPDESGNQANTHIWGAQLEGVSGGLGGYDGPSSYIATQGSAVSRAQDHLTLGGIGFGVQTCTVYSRHVETGEADAREGLWSLGFGSGSGGYSFWCQGGGAFQEYALRAYDADGNVTPEISAGADPSLGDVVECRAVMIVSGGTVTAKWGQALNGGSEQTAQSADGAFGTAGSVFDQNEVRLAKRSGSSSRSYADFLNFLVLPGVRTMDEMRSLEV